MSRAKEKHVIPEHLLNVPLSAEQQHKIVARVNALYLFILDGVSDPDARKEIEDQIKQKEAECLKKLKENIKERVRKTHSESRFTTQETKKEKGGKIFTPMS